MAAQNLEIEEQEQEQYYETTPSSIVDVLPAENITETEERSCEATSRQV